MNRHATFAIFENELGKVVLHRYEDAFGFGYSMILDGEDGARPYPQSFIRNHIDLIESIFETLDRRVSTHGVEVNVYGRV